jgi:hypothetical protein
VHFVLVQRVPLTKKYLNLHGAVVTFGCAFLCVVVVSPMFCSSVCFFQRFFCVVFLWSKNWKDCLGFCLFSSPQIIGNIFNQKKKNRVEAALLSGRIKKIKSGNWQ